MRGPLLGGIGHVSKESVDAFERALQERIPEFRTDAFMIYFRNVAPELFRGFLQGEPDKIKHLLTPQVRNHHIGSLHINMSYYFVSHGC
jgi:hypothetical protein